MKYLVTHEECYDTCDDDFDTLQEALAFINQLLEQGIPFNDIKLIEYKTIKLEPVDVVKSARVAT